MASTPPEPVPDPVAVEPSRSGARTAVELVLAAVGLVGHFGVALLMLVSGLAVPIWAVLAMLAVWTVLLILGIRWWHHTPLVGIAIPVVAFVLWVATLALGGGLLGWTA